MNGTWEETLPIRNPDFYFQLTPDICLEAWQEKEHWVMQGILFDGHEINMAEKGQWDVSQTSRVRAAYMRILAKRYMRPF